MNIDDAYTHEVGTFGKCQLGIVLLNYAYAVSFPSLVSELGPGVAMRELLFIEGGVFLILNAFGFMHPVPDFTMLTDILAQAYAINILCGNEIVFL